MSRDGERDAARVSFKTTCPWEAELTDGPGCPFPLSPLTSPFLPVSKFLLRDIWVGDSPAPAPHFRRILQPTETLTRAFLLLPSRVSEAFSGTKRTHGVAQACSPRPPPRVGVHTSSTFRKPRTTE